MQSVPRCRPFRAADRSALARLSASAPSPCPAARRLLIGEYNISGVNVDFNININISINITVDDDDKTNVFSHHLHDTIIIIITIHYCHFHY